MHADVPLLDTTAPNPLEFFQIWLNLPAASKLANPHFAMSWSEDVPRLLATSPSGARTEVVCIAGRLSDGTTLLEPLAPPPDSWASSVDNDVAIWTCTRPGPLDVPPARGGQKASACTLRRDRVGVGAQRSTSPRRRAAARRRAGHRGRMKAEFLSSGRPLPSRCGSMAVRYYPELEVRQAFATPTDHSRWRGPTRILLAPNRPLCRHADGASSAPG